MTYVLSKFVVALCISTGGILFLILIGYILGKLTDPRLVSSSRSKLVTFRAFANHQRYIRGEMTSEQYRDAPSEPEIRDLPRRPNESDVRAVLDHASEIISEYAYNGHTATSVADGKHTPGFCVTCADQYSKAQQVLLELDKWQ